MYVLSACGASLAGAAGYVITKRWRDCRMFVEPFDVPPRREDNIDVVMHGCNKLVRCHTFSDKDSMDDIFPRLINWFIVFSPTEDEMAVMSLLQQRTSGQGDENEFVVLTVYLAASHALSKRIRGPPLKTTCRIRRSHTWPADAHGSIVEASTKGSVGNFKWMHCMFEDARGNEILVTN